jgi:predicted HD phosphohydrolase
MLGKRFDDALASAAELHRDHARKGTDRNAAGEPVSPTPYLAHLLVFASLALEAGADEHEAIAALLHDAIEDRPHGGKTAREIAEVFGPDVLAIVKGCTKVQVEPGLDHEARRSRRREIRRAYFEHLRHADPSVLLVSAADKLHNARAIIADLRERGPSMFDRFNDDREGTLWYYRGVLEALRDGAAPRRLVDALQMAVDEMHQLAGSAKSSSGDREPGFVIASVAELPAEFVRAIAEQVPRLREVHGLALDATAFEPAAAAVRRFEGINDGELVSRSSPGERSEPSGSAARPRSSSRS